MIRVERHALGLRCFVLGRRLHEWHVGLALLITAAASAVAGVAVVTGVLAVVGGWLVVKDANDLVPSRRNTTSWSLGLPAGRWRCVTARGRQGCHHWRPGSPPLSAPSTSSRR